MPPPVAYDTSALATCGFALHAFDNATFADRLGAWTRAFTNVYSAPLADAIYFDGSASQVAFPSAGFPGAQATFALRALAVGDALQRQLITLAAVGVGTISITSGTGGFGLTLTP
jgi:hypothetical protein